MKPCPIFTNSNETVPYIYYCVAPTRDRVFINYWKILGLIIMLIASSSIYIAYRCPAEETKDQARSHSFYICSSPVLKGQLSFVHGPFVCKFFIFSSSPLPLGQFQPNLSQIIFWVMGSQIALLKGHALFQGEIIAKINSRQNQRNLAHFIIFG